MSHITLPLPDRVQTGPDETFRAYTARRHSVRGFGAGRAVAE